MECDAGSDDRSNPLAELDFLSFSDEIITLSTTSAEFFFVLVTRGFRSSFEDIIVFDGSCPLPLTSRCLAVVRLTCKDPLRYTVSDKMLDFSYKILNCQVKGRVNLESGMENP